MSDNEQPPPIPPVDPGTAVPTPPHKTPDSSLYSQQTVVIEHPWQPPFVAPAPPPPPVPVAPTAPVNVDVPYASQTGTTLNCTMGNWQGEPIGYTYQWQRDGDVIGALAPQYFITDDDIGTTFACIVTAFNAAGAVSITSNDVTVVATPPDA
jgi:hypothetical protein